MTKLQARLEPQPDVIYSEDFDLGGGVTQELALDAQGNKWYRISSHAQLAQDYPTLHINGPFWTKWYRLNDDDASAQASDRFPSEAKG